MSQVGIRAEAPPAAALHLRYTAQQAYVDCFTTQCAYPVTLAEFVEAFYTTWLFKLERAVLQALVRKPSTDAQAAGVARGEITDFAAWSVEARADNQLLMCDFQGATRSWFMVEPGMPGTRLYFGSVVTARRDGRTGERKLGTGYRALLGFHRLYSRALLAAARARLHRQRSRFPFQES